MNALPKSRHYAVAGQSRSLVVGDRVRVIWPGSWMHSKRTVIEAIDGGMATVHLPDDPPEVRTGLMLTKLALA